MPLLFVALIPIALSAQDPPAAAPPAPVGTFHPVVRPADGKPGEGFDVSGSAELPDGAVLTVQVQRFLDGPEGERTADIPVSHLCIVEARRFQERLLIPGTPAPGLYRLTFEIDAQSLPSDEAVRFARRRTAPVVLTCAAGPAKAWAAWIAAERERLAAARGGAARVFEDLSAYLKGRSRDTNKEDTLIAAAEQAYEPLQPRLEEPDLPFAAADEALAESVRRLMSAIPRKLVDEDGNEEPLVIDGKTVSGAEVFDQPDLREAREEAVKGLAESVKTADRLARVQFGLAAAALLRRAEGADAGGTPAPAELAADAEAVAGTLGPADGTGGPSLRVWLDNFSRQVAAWGAALPPDAATRLAPLARDLEGIRAEQRK